nr:phosphorylase [Bacteroidales bacterium]
RFGEWRITNFEMEGSALAGLAGQLGHDAGTVCCAIANRHLGSSNTDYKPRVRGLVELALDKLAEN